MWTKGVFQTKTYGLFTNIASSGVHPTIFNLCADYSFKLLFSYRN